ncbi:DUF3592 domain-containing protein [Brachybacterium hainanense]|uniref:DUF3592 domain-containing protein n=1 Tax=Brachybacterium hainanense TaxID=1541174 RepID=A0ABV6R7L7_9MICO
MKLVLVIIWAGLALAVVSATGSTLWRTWRHDRITVGWPIVRAVVTGSERRLLGSLNRINRRRYFATYAYRTRPDGPVHAGTSDLPVRTLPVPGSPLEVRVDPADPRRSSHQGGNTLLGLGCASSVLLGVLVIALLVITALPID